MSDDDRFSLTLQRREKPSHDVVNEKQEGKLPSTISFSSLNLFNSCPLAWKFQYVNNLKVPKLTVALEIGSAFHKIVELYDGSKSVESIVSENSFFGNLSVQAVNDAIKIFKKWYTPDKFENIATIAGKPAKEVYFEIPLDNSMKLIGFIDAIKELNNHVEIIDYKTGSSLYTNDMQLSIYSMPVFRDNPDLEELKVTFEYVNEGVNGVKKSRIISRKDLPMIEAIVKSKVAAIIKSFEDNNFIAKPGVACRSCPFTGACKPYQDYIASQPYTSENLPADKLEETIKDISTRIEIQQKYLEELKQIYESKYPENVSTYTVYRFSKDPSTIVKILQENNIPLDKYVYLKSTLGTDIAKNRIKIPPEARDKIMEGVIADIIRKLNMENEE
ncbi:MAG: PD-(D/E)XK nuclease family protein [Candidatus Parvarchaeota archaeon]